MTPSPSDSQKKAHFYRPRVLLKNQIIRFASCSKPRIIPQLYMYSTMTNSIPFTKLVGLDNKWWNPTAYMRLCDKGSGLFSEFTAWFHNSREPCCDCLASDKANKTTKTEVYLDIWNIFFLVSKHQLQFIISNKYQYLTYY